MHESILMSEPSFVLDGHAELGFYHATVTVPPQAFFLVGYNSLVVISSTYLHKGIPVNGIRRTSVFYPPGRNKQVIQKFYTWDKSTLTRHVAHKAIV